MVESFANLSRHGAEAVHRAREAHRARAADGDDRGAGRCIQALRK
jgi:hypothetical protein